MANCMIQSKGIRLNFWAKAIDCANYIVNHIPTKALKNITLKEAWSIVKQKVIPFHVFARKSWVHILDKKNKALKTNYDK